MTATDLKRRWSHPGRLRLVREVRSRLIDPGPQPELGTHELGTHSGRLDLRGIPLLASPAVVVVGGAAVTLGCSG